MFTQIRQRKDKNGKQMLKLWSEGGCYSRFSAIFQVCA